MPGLGTSFGRGGATDFQQDLQNSDCIVIMGSNMAENHPVGFQWVMEARERGAKVIHVDPRFTRTSAMATKRVGIRAGSDIAFLGGIVNYILENDRWFDEYVKHYTNAPVIIDEEFADTEDLDGLFSGWDPEKRQVRHRRPGSTRAWRCTARPASARGLQRDEGRAVGHGGHGGGLAARRAAARRTRRSQHPRCVFQILKRHYARYTPEFVAETCGCTRRGVPRRLRGAVRELGPRADERVRATRSAGRSTRSASRSSARAAIIQLLLGNIGRPGGGIIALRGHASIQGSTDIPTLYNIAARLPADAAHASSTATSTTSSSEHVARRGWWGNSTRTVVSLLKAWWGDARDRRERLAASSYLPRIDDDNSHYWTVEQMLDGKVKGYIVAGENPAVGSRERQGAPARAREARLARRARPRRDRDRRRSGTTARRSSRASSTPEEIATEVFFLPAAAHIEKDGSFTNTQRLLQWHYKAVEPKDDCRSELWFYFHLGRLISERLAGVDGAAGPAAARR